MRSVAFPLHYVHTSSILAEMDAHFQHVGSRHPNAIGSEQKARFLEAYGRLKNMAAAADEVGVKHSTARSWVHRHKKRAEASSETS